jgi:hypothetical protein
MYKRCARAWLVFAFLGLAEAQAQFPGYYDPRFGPDLKLPLDGLNKIMPGLGNSAYLPPLPGTPLGQYMPPPGHSFHNNNGFSKLQNQFGAGTPWPWQNPFTPSHWNFAGWGNGYSPWANYGSWTGPPFGQYGYSGYGQFAPIVGANNGWFPYEPPLGGNPWGFGGGYGWGGASNPFMQNPFAPNNMMFPRLP